MIKTNTTDKKRKRISLRRKTLKKNKTLKKSKKNSKRRMNKSGGADYAYGHDTSPTPQEEIYNDMDNYFK